MALGYSKFTNWVDYMFQEITEIWLAILNFACLYQYHFESVVPSRNSLLKQKTSHFITGTYSKLYTFSFPPSDINSTIAMNNLTFAKCYGRGSSKNIFISIFQLAFASFL